MKKKIFFLLFYSVVYTQSVTLNESFLYNYYRLMELDGKIEFDNSLLIRPLNSSLFENEFNNNIYNNFTLTNNNKIHLSILPLNYSIEYNSKHPYKRNNGSMIPNSGYQHLVSLGFYLKLGPLSIQINPEHIFAENLEYDGFWEGHYDSIWAERYSTWNNIDIPERFGINHQNQLLIGQSSIKLNFKTFSIGVSNENIWWGPAQRNSIMMSNNARGFKHISFNSIEPVKTKIGKFEWQLISGRLEPSGYTPPNTDRTYGGVKLYIPKENEIREVDWRYFQGLVIVYSPKWIDGFSLGHIRWAQMYSALTEGRYAWLGQSNYFPIFTNLFRKNDLNSDIQEQIDQGAGLFFRWIWKKEKTEIYAEYHYDDSKLNFRDLMLDDDNARASTLGIKKVFNTSKNNYEVSWEWTKMEQSGSRLLRGGGSWYRHAFIKHGYTNHGEIIGSAIGPGSNSHFFSLTKFKKHNLLSLGFEIIENDNDFYYAAFQDAGDFRRYWKDFNFHLNFTKKFKNFWLSSNLVFIRSLNYQWELNETGNDYYQPGRDISSFHTFFQLIYRFPFQKLKK